MGSTLPSLRARSGDFEDWIIDGAGLSRSEVRVIDAPAGESLPEPGRDGPGGPDAPAGVIITGSHSMVTEMLPWSVRAAAWLREVVARDVAVLGICYGHQLLAHAHGGAVGNNPRGTEVGTMQVTRDAGAGPDDLLDGLPATFSAHESHTQSVLSLPPGAVRLASNEWDSNQAFRLGSRAWGVQFHPEFDAEILHGYIEAERAMLAAEGQDADALDRTVKDGPLGSQILRRFADLCRACRAEG